MSENDRLSVALVILSPDNETIYYKEGLTVEQADAVSKLNGKCCGEFDNKSGQPWVDNYVLLAWMVKPYHEGIFEEDEEDMKQKVEQSGLKARPHLCCLFDEGLDCDEWTMEGKKVDRLYFCRVV